MSESLRICVDVYSPTRLLELRKQRAANVASRAFGGPGPVRAIAPIETIWPNGSTLRVKFLGGTAAERATVERVASEWMKHANVKLQFGATGASEIRVAFVQDGRSWSYLGTDNLRIPAHAATMNFGWPLEEGTILHEFGHALGLSHEHQNPQGGIRWNEPVVLRELSGPPNEWDEDTIRSNVLEQYAQDQIRGTTFDKDSIMLYAFPARWTLNNVGTKENNKLSTVDCSFVGAAEMYPFPNGGDPAVVELPVIETTGVTADIGGPGEEDLYKFTAKKAGTYTIETAGNTDVVMRLFGPDNRTKLIGEDDDSGAASNARLIVNLAPGEYFVQIRHFNPNAATGTYQIKVSM